MLEQLKSLFRSKPMSQISGLTVGRTIVSDHIQVHTYWQDDHYETLAQHPIKTEGKTVVVGSYGKDFHIAHSEHQKWVKFFCSSDQNQQEDVDLEVKSVKISIHTLLKMLYGCCGMGDIKISGSRDNPNVIFIAINQGRHHGNCFYDFARMEAWAITPQWFAWMEEAKNELLDKAEFNAKDEDEGSSLHQGFA